MPGYCIYLLENGETKHRPKKRTLGSLVLHRKGHLEFESYWWLYMCSRGQSLRMAEVNHVPFGAINVPDVFIIAVKSFHKIFLKFLLCANSNLL